ncbi:MAG: GNAT family N-acetyltransferase [Actinobacteria bacterium]|nr:GNAT family N-acetyltransferase [Actinomycetota bacterium]
MPLVTRRLTLRPLTAADGGDVYAVFAAPEVMRSWNSAPPRDVVEAGEWAAHFADMQRRLGYAHWRVSERAGDRLVGIAGLQPLDGGPDVELTYALEPSTWGIGYATEAAAAALEYGFEEARLDRIVAIAGPGNAASLHVLEKLGMRRCGEAEHWGRTWSRYDLTAADWRAERAAATPPLVTERLELRRFTPADLEPLLTVFGDPDVMRFVGAERRPLDRKGVATLLAGAEAQWQRHGLGLLAVVERGTGRLIGEAGLQPLEAGPDIEVGYTLARAAWGRGYATEAARAVLLWAFARLRLHRVIAVADPANGASLQVLGKLGMRRLGMRHCYGAQMVESALSLGEWRAGAGPAPARP